MLETFVHVRSLNPAALIAEIVLHAKATAPAVVIFTHLSMADMHFVSLAEPGVPT